MPPEQACHRCDGRLVSVLTRVEYPYEGDSYPLQNVPVEICPACGSKHILERHRKAIDRMLARSLRAEAQRAPLGGPGATPRSRNARSRKG